MYCPPVLPPPPALPQEAAQEYLQEEKLKELVQRYSEFINFPIYMLTTRTEEKEVRGVVGVTWLQSRFLCSRKVIVFGGRSRLAATCPSDDYLHLPALPSPSPSPLLLTAPALPALPALPQVPDEDAVVDAPAEAAEEKSQEEEEVKKAEDAKEGETVEVAGECAGCFAALPALQESVLVLLLLLLSRCCCWLSSCRLSLLVGLWPLRHAAQSPADPPPPRPMLCPPNCLPQMRRRRLLRSSPRPRR